jgi:hypothetical protein
VHLSNRLNPWGCDCIEIDENESGERSRSGRTEGRYVGEPGEVGPTRIPDSRCGTGFLRTVPEDSLQLPRVREIDATRCAGCVLGARIRRDVPFDHRDDAEAVRFSFQTVKVEEMSRFLTLYSGRGGAVRGRLGGRAEDIGTVGAFWEFEFRSATLALRAFQGANAGQRKKAVGHG